MFENHLWRICVDVEYCEVQLKIHSRIYFVHSTTREQWIFPVIKRRIFFKWVNHKMLFLLGFIMTNGSRASRLLQLNALMTSLKWRSCNDRVARKTYKNKEQRYSRFDEINAASFYRFLPELPNEAIHLFFNEMTILLTISPQSSFSYSQIMNLVQFLSHIA